MAFTMSLIALSKPTFISAIHHSVSAEQLNSYAFIDKPNPAFAPPLAVVSEWAHPGVRRLQSLGSVVVEVNMRREVPWVMPQTIGEVTAKLGRIGVATVPQLIAALGPPAGGPGGINTLLRALDPPAREFSMETIGVLRGLLL